MNYKDNIIEDEIVSIEEFGIIDTIDIEVESKDRLFFANDILTHNSGWETNDLGLGSIAESAGLLHTVDILFGIVTNAEMKAGGEYYLKCLANRVAGYENTRKRFLINWKHARIEEDRNAPIQDMEFFINKVTSGHSQPRGQQKSTSTDMHTFISEHTEPLEPDAKEEKEEDKDKGNANITGRELFGI
jgi:hypothetical protein